MIHVHFDGDLYKAYDTTDHGIWAEAFNDAGIHPIITAAMIREVRRCRGRLVLPNLDPSPPVGRSRSIYQGDPQGPKTFNIVVDRKLVKPYLKLCSDNDWGYPLSHDDWEQL